MNPGARDPQLAAIRERMALLEGGVDDQRARLRALRAEIDGFWVSERRSADEPTMWVFRRRPIRPSRSA